MLGRIARVAAAIAIAFTAVVGCANHNQHWEHNCKINDKTILQNVSGDKNSTHTTNTKRLTTSCGVYDVEDAWEAGSFSSYDLWAKLEPGKSYDLRVGGIRSGFFSSFETVLEVKGPNGS